jgi:hypothetical protein
VSAVSTLPYVSKIFTTTVPRRVPAAPDEGAVVKESVLGATGVRAITKSRGWLATE